MSEDQKFNEKVHRAAMQEGRYVIPIEGMRFTLDKIGNGYFSEALRGTDAEGVPVVLKVFNGRLDQGARNFIRNGLRDNIDVFEDPFAKLRVVFPEGEHFFAYVADFFNGVSVDDCLRGKKSIVDGKPVDLNDRNIQGRIFSTYLRALRKLHANGLLYYDNNWGNVLVNHTGVRVIDPDGVRKLEELNNDFAVPATTNIYTPSYASRANALYTLHELREFALTDDLEGFALMVDRFYNRSSFFRCWIHRDPYDVLNDIVPEERGYRAERVRNIPEKLRDVVVPIIEKPSNHGVTLGDLEGVVSSVFSL
jgi:hypothetical protein